MQAWPQAKTAGGPFEVWLGTLEDKGAKAAALLFMDIFTGKHDEESSDHPTDCFAATILFSSASITLPGQPCPPTPLHSNPPDLT